MGEIELREERWSEVESEIGPLLAAHSRELAGGEINLDWRLLTFAQESLVVVTARESGELIGYCIWMIGPDIARAGGLVAELKPWYIRVDKRGGSAGIRLFKRSLEILRARNVERCYPHHWGDARLGKFFESIGARPREWVFELEL